MISRRKTIGTLCDALQAQGDAGERAIQSLLKPSTARRTAPKKAGDSALTLTKLRQTAETMASKTEGITIKPAKDADYRHDRDDAILIESRAEYYDPSGKRVSRKDSYRKLLAFRKALTDRFPGKVSWLRKPYAQGSWGLTKFDTSSWRTVVSILKKPEPSPQAPDLKTFARQTFQKASKVPRSKRFGPNLVFIGDVGKGAPFKEKLKQAYDQDLIDLVKADMPQALPQDKLKESALKGRTVTFHFIRVGKEEI